jgi:hypothetical protein
MHNDPRVPRLGPSSNVRYNAAAGHLPAVPHNRQWAIDNRQSQ